MGWQEGFVPFVSDGFECVASSCGVEGAPEFEKDFSQLLMGVYLFFDIGLGVAAQSNSLEYFDEVGVMLGYP